jgi:hypothetical protein
VPPSFVHRWFLPSTVRRAVTVALVVGPVLTLINQHEALIGLDLRPRVLLKIALTFLVPYLVSSYSSAVALARAPNAEVDHERSS